MIDPEHEFSVSRLDDSILDRDEKFWDENVGFNDLQDKSTGLIMLESRCVILS